MQTASYFRHLKFLPLKGGDFVDKELAGTLIDVVIGCAFIMAFIVAACLVTPKIARLMEKKFPQLKDSPERVEETVPSHFPPPFRDCLLISSIKRQSRKGGGKCEGTVSRG